MTLSYFTSEQYSALMGIMVYANDAVFKDEIWNNISYQMEHVTAVFRDGAIDVGIFMYIPLQELTKFKDEKFRIAADINSQMKLKDNYYMSEGKNCYLWLVTRMGIPTVKDASCIEMVQIYKLLTRDQIAVMAKKG